MESIYPPAKKHEPGAHKLETPQPLAKDLREAATAVAGSISEGREQNLVIYMQTVKSLRDKFAISYPPVKEKREAKAREAGLFSERRIQEIPHIGYKLVRDKRSGVPLERDQRREYLDFLNQKLVEVTEELIEAMGEKERIEELADVYEVSELIMHEYGFDVKLIERKRQVYETSLWRKRRNERKGARRRMVHNNS